MSTRPLGRTSKIDAKHAALTKNLYQADVQGVAVLVQTAVQVSIRKKSSGTAPLEDLDAEQGSTKVRGCGARRLSVNRASVR